MSSPAYEGGSGGYFKRRLFKNSARTPYERPPSAAHGVRSTATVKGNDGRWLPTFREPVTRFITRTACRLLSSVLPKRLSTQSGVEEKHLVKLDTPVVILAEQKLADCHSLITSKSGGISDIEQFISERWFTRNEAKHFMASINSRSSELLESESENNKQVKVRKRDISFLDDDNVLLGPLCKIPKKSIMTVPLRRKSYFHMSAPEDDDLEEDVVENAPCTIAISGGAITTNSMNETSTSISCHRKSCFHMSAPEDIDDSDEEYDITEESDQSLFNLGTFMNDGSTGTCGSNNEGDFTFPSIIDLEDHSSPPTPTMSSPSHVQLPFQKD